MEIHKHRVEWVLLLHRKACAPPSRSTGGKPHSPSLTMHPIFFLLFPPNGSTSRASFPSIVPSHTAVLPALVSLLHSSSHWQISSSCLENLSWLLVCTKLRVLHPCSVGVPSRPSRDQSGDVRVWTKMSASPSQKPKPPFLNAPLVDFHFFMSWKLKGLWNCQWRIKSCRRFCSQWPDGRSNVQWKSPPGFTADGRGTAKQCREKFKKTTERPPKHQGPQQEWNKQKMLEVCSATKAISESMYEDCEWVVTSSNLPFKAIVM